MAAVHTVPKSLFVSDDRYLSAEQCTTLGKRTASFAQGGGDTGLFVTSWWTGAAEWARNRISMATDQRKVNLMISRSIRGASGMATTNQIDDVSLQSAVRAAEGISRFSRQAPRVLDSGDPPTFEYLKTQVWSDATIALSSADREKIVRTVTETVESAGLSTAGHLETRVGGSSFGASSTGTLYCPMTDAEFTLTVRDPKANASGWAGDTSYDWKRIDHAALLARAMDKCIKSRNPVAVEPGRWTVVLEPQAGYDLIGPVIGHLDRKNAEDSPMSPFHEPGTEEDSRLGQRVGSDIVTISQDPTDPDLGVVPFSWGGEPFLPATWIDRGILRMLSYGRGYAIPKMNEEEGRLNSGAFKIHGGTSSLDEMIQSTERGILITRFSGIRVMNPFTLMMTGTTRDGTWLIERGKIAKPVKNFRFVDSPLFTLNNIVELGTPTRVVSLYAPALVPPIKARDFNLQSLADAI